MRTGLAMVSLIWMCSATACKDQTPTRDEREPMRAPANVDARPMSAAPDPVAEPDHDQTEDAALPQRPPADPEIERALSLIGKSGLRFLDSRSDPAERPSEYTAEQFAAMLRTKWDWLGYDLTTLEPWLEEIATRSFKTNLPYRVVIGDGTTSELRPWLDAQLAERPLDDR